MVATRPSADQIRVDLVRLVHRGLPIVDFAPAATRLLRSVIPFDGTCLLTLDPATLLATGVLVENGLPATATLRLNDIELREPDVNKLTAPARRPSPAASLSDATRGDLDRSLRHRELRRPNGFADELRTVLPDGSGTWGALTLLRAVGTPHFTTAEVEWVASLAGILAEGVRRAVRPDGAITGAPGPDAGPGLLVLAPDHTVEMSNTAAERWLDELARSDELPADLPLVIHAVACRARQSAGCDGATGDSRDLGLARARVRTTAGRWLVARGSLLDDGPESRVVVLLEPAHAPELAALIVAGYGLTERERRVIELVARGFSTKEISAQLRLSAYTVQDHVRSIFAKSGTSSRGELVARLFVDHYARRLDPGDPQAPAGLGAP